MKALTRDVLPLDPATAIENIQHRSAQLKEWRRVAAVIWRDLHEEDPTLPYVWDPSVEA
ncbi:hypothetical protein ACF07L_34975 [Streptomyces anulatus]|uniref:hypothetical protein n=1 Tax=Streptomyces anulatus TaxID=1892 RepID=UPI0036F87C3B